MRLSFMRPVLRDGRALEDFPPRPTPYSAATHSHITDHNRQILDAVGFHHDTCKVDRTQYVILISAVMCLSMFVRVDPKANDSSSTLLRRSHSESLHAVVFYVET